MGISYRYPALVRRLVDGGHELASHGYEHLRANEQGYGAFLADIRLAKAVLEDVAGREVKGYRAPSFSIGPANFWAFDCIAEAGYRYSSSIYPIRHDHYGAPDAPRFPYQVSEPARGAGRNGSMWNPNRLAGGGWLLPYRPPGRSATSTLPTGGRDALAFIHGSSTDSRVSGPAPKRAFNYLNLTHRAAPEEPLAATSVDRVDRVFLNGGT
jgi:polysaccharide deacetylase family protein (PEP-CTERM system associated)